MAVVGFKSLEIDLHDFNVICDTNHVFDVQLRDIQYLGLSRLKSKKWHIQQLPKIQKKFELVIIIYPVEYIIQHVFWKESPEISQTEIMSKFVVFKLQQLKYAFRHFINATSKIDFRVKKKILQSGFHFNTQKEFFDYLL
jgi:hypothetical protein